jgi:4'-phosphopantetheinyl transferase
MSERPQAGERKIPALSPGVLHAWTLSTPRLETSTHRLFSLLAPDERERANTFKFTLAQRRYVVSRSVLRLLLGSYTALPPSELRFAYGPHGKPRLATRHRPPAVRFSLTHSGDIVVYAFVLGRHVGVDVEEQAPIGDVRELARRYLSDCERRPLVGTFGSAVQSEFARAWTRKEAYLKAVGTGLTARLSEICVADADPIVGNAATLRRGCAHAPRGSWSIVEFVPRRGFVGAVVVSGAQPLELRIDAVPAGIAVLD